MQLTLHWWLLIACAMTTSLTDSSSHGKKAMFLEQWGLGLHVIASQVSRRHKRPGHFIKRGPLLC